MRRFLCVNLKLRFVCRVKLCRIQNIILKYDHGVTNIWKSVKLVLYMYLKTYIEHFWLLYVLGYICSILGKFGRMSENVYIFCLRHNRFFTNFSEIPPCGSIIFLLFKKHLKTYQIPRKNKQDFLTYFFWKSGT